MPLPLFSPLGGRAGVRAAVRRALRSRSIGATRSRRPRTSITSLPTERPTPRGRRSNNPTTLDAAIERVVTGDAIVMRGGVYRTGGLTLNQGITLQPYADERPILKGTQVATKWEALRNNVWKTSWTRLFPAAPLGWWQRDREGMRTPLHRFNNDMVFVDGELLKSAGWEGELDAHSFYIDYKSGNVYIGVDPTNRLVEITAFDSALVRTSGAGSRQDVGSQGPGRSAASRSPSTPTARSRWKARSTSPSTTSPPTSPWACRIPATFGKEVTGTVLENVTITYCSRVAGYFRGDGLVIRNSLVSDTSTEGIYVIGSSDVLLERNIFRRNNIKQLTGYYPAAVKIFNQTRRVTCRDNLVIDQPYSNGIWYDVGNRDGVFVNNWIEGAHGRLLLRDLARGDRGGQCLRPLRQGRPRAELRRRARLQQHVRGHAGVLRAQRAERDRRPLRLASLHRPGRGPARRPRVRE